MRIYFNSPEQETSYELVKTNNIFQVIETETGQTLNIHTRKIGEKKFYSMDGIKWTPLRDIHFFDEFVWNNQKYKVFQGFKPSSLFEDAAGGLVTQIPGKVIKLKCQEGDEVKQGDTLLILEAMKMENEIKANIDGKVESIYIQEGQSLEAGTLMIEIV